MEFHSDTGKLNPPSSSLTRKHLRNELHSYFFKTIRLLNADEEKWHSDKRPDDAEFDVSELN